MTMHNSPSFVTFLGYIYLLGKGGYVFGNVGLSVCLSADNITQKVMNVLGEILWRGPG